MFAIGGREGRAAIEDRADATLDLFIGRDTTPRLLASLMSVAFPPLTSLSLSVSGDCLTSMLDNLGNLAHTHTPFLASGWRKIVS